MLLSFGAHRFRKSDCAFRVDVNTQGTHRFSPDHSQRDPRIAEIKTPSWEGYRSMVALWRRWLQRWQAPTYARRPPLVLVNGLAEQAETWFFNLAAWRRDFDVYVPNLISYEGETLHRRIRERQPIDIDYLVEQLRTYITQYVQAPPYNLVANSMGGKVAVEYAVRYPEDVARLVLLCPSGLAEQERLPIIEGVRRNDMQTVVDSVFYDASCVPPSLGQYYKAQNKKRLWRTGLLKTVRGTMDHRVRHLLPRVTQPTLIVVGREDRIVNAREAAEAARRLPRGKMVTLPRCGHAPQIEAAETINRLVTDFLRQSTQATAVRGQPARAEHDLLAETSASSVA
jgi:pimeloyl-ACP methyl ester carboxylesterase